MDESHWGGQPRPIVVVVRHAVDSVPVAMTVSEILAREWPGSVRLLCLPSDERAVVTTLVETPQTCSLRFPTS